MALLIFVVKIMRKGYNKPFSNPNPEVPLKRIFIIALGFCSQFFGSSFDSTIPVVNMEDYYHHETRDSFVEQVGNALRDVGFFAVINPGVDIKALDDAYRIAAEFFHQTQEYKFSTYRPEINQQRGYVPGESAKGQKFSDFKEFYHIGRELSEEDAKRLETYTNVWPENMDLKTPMNRLFDALEKHIIPLQEAMALAIGQPKDFFVEKTTEGNTILRAIHYPSNPPSNRIWAAAHTDINLFTILPRATAEGLQVQNKQGEWITVKVPENAFIVNGADELQHITNGEFRSGPHRVIAMGENYERFSMVLFVHPRNFDDMSPVPECIKRTGGKPRFAKAKAIEILAERLADLGIASESLLKFLGESGFLERQIEIGNASKDAMQAVCEAGYASAEVEQALNSI